MTIDIGHVEQVVINMMHNDIVIQQRLVIDMVNVVDKHKDVIDYVHVNMRRIWFALELHWRKLKFAMPKWDIHM